MVKVHLLLSVRYTRILTTQFSSSGSYFHEYLERAFNSYFRKTVKMLSESDWIHAIHWTWHLFLCSVNLNIIMRNRGEFSYWFPFCLHFNMGETSLTCVAKRNIFVLIQRHSALLHTHIHLNFLKRNYLWSLCWVFIAVLRLLVVASPVSEHGL